MFNLPFKHKCQHFNFRAKLNIAAYLPYILGALVFLAITSYAVNMTTSSVLEISEKNKRHPYHPNRPTAFDDYMIDYDDYIDIPSWMCPDIGTDYIQLKGPRLPTVATLKKMYPTNAFSGSRYLQKEFGDLKQNLNVSRESEEILDNYKALLINMYQCDIQPAFRNKYQQQIKEDYDKEINAIMKTYNFTSYPQETFIVRHGLRYASQKILDYIYNRDIIDAEAFNGESLVVFLKYTSQKVFEYEKYPDSVAEINRTIRDYHLEKRRIRVINKELSNMTIMSLVQTKTQELPVEVPITTIDKEVAEKNIRVGFMKINSDGEEYATLEGANQTIHKYRPVISVEAYQNLPNFFNVIDFLKKLNNYTLKFLYGSSKIVSDKLLILAYPNDLE